MYIATYEKCILHYMQLYEVPHPPVTNNSNSEYINKVVKLPWIPTIGPKLRQKKKNEKLKIAIIPKQNKCYQIVFREYTN